MYERGGRSGCGDKFAAVADAANVQSCLHRRETEHAVMDGVGVREQIDILHVAPAEGVGHEDDGPDRRSVVDEGVKIIF